MPASQELTSFIQSTFASVWSLELACLLRKAPDRAMTQESLIAALRASDLVVTQSVRTLHAAGVLMIEADGTVRYSPISERVDQLVGETEALYLTRPDQVRRMIVSPRTSPLTSFANAFKLGEP